MKSKRSQLALAPTTSNNFNYLTSQVFFRNSFTAFSEANVSIASSPVLYGLAIYTVFNVIWDENERNLKIFRLKDHYDRLVKSAKIMDFGQFIEDWPYEKFEGTIVELLKRNKVTESVLVRASVFIDELIAGARINGLQNSLSAYIYPMGEILPRKGVHLCVSSWMRNPDNSIPSRAKVNGSYVNASLMKNEALLNGYDDAIALDEHGHVAESTVANFFVVRKGELITAGQATDILEGITRSTILTLAEEQGIKVTERSIDRSELYVADEAFLCGSSANLTPVLSIDKRTVGGGEMGPVTKRLSRVYQEAQLGRAHPDWCLPVPLQMLNC